MKKNIHPESTETVFTCTSCNAKFAIASTVKASEMAIDICSQCHPFYIGSTAQQSVKGRAEKLSSKFATGKETMTSTVKKPKDKPVSKAQNSKAKSLSDL